MSVRAKVADHNSVLVTVPDSIELREFPDRRIWCYSNADWAGLKGTLLEIDWQVLYEGTVDDAVNFFYSILDNAMAGFIFFFCTVALCRLQPIEKNAPVYDIQSFIP